MGFGSTAKKVQKLADVAEKTYSRLNDLREQIQQLRDTVDETGERVEALEAEVAEQRAVLDAIAREHDIDPDGVVADTETAAVDGQADPVASED